MNWHRDIWAQAFSSLGLRLQVMLARRQVLVSLQKHPPPRAELCAQALARSQAALSLVFAHAGPA